MLNIVIPMAGLGSRFKTAGYVLPKPLIKVDDKTMIELVIDNLMPSQEHRFIFICLEDHLKKYPLKHLLQEKCSNAIILSTAGLTEGAACTVLLAKKYINCKAPLMIANCDQYISININNYLETLASRNLDGLIMTMYANDSKWSFIAFDKNSFVTQVAEKKVISNEATVGIYNFRSGSDFVAAAELMIKKNIRTNNEFYVAPVYNEMIAAHKKISFFNIGSENNGMHGLGTPEDLNNFINHKLI